MLHDSWVFPGSVPVNLGSQHVGKHFSSWWPTCWECKRLSAPGLESAPGSSDTFLPQTDPTPALTSRRPGGEGTSLLLTPVWLCWSLNTWVNFVPSLCLPLDVDTTCFISVETLLGRVSPCVRSMCASLGVCMWCVHGYGCRPTRLCVCVCFVCVWKCAYPF